MFGTGGLTNTTASMKHRRGILDRDRPRWFDCCDYARYVTPLADDYHGTALLWEALHHRFGPEIVVDCNLLRDHCNRDCNRLYDNVCSYQKHNHSITHSVTTMASHNLQALCIVGNFFQGYKACKANGECNRLLTSGKHRHLNSSL